MIFFILLAQAGVQIPAVGCETVGAELFCPPVEVSDPYFGPAAQINFRDRVERARKALAEKERAPAELRKRVGTLIANNDCEGAYKLALTQGDLDLAVQAQQLCAGLSNPN